MASDRDVLEHIRALVQEEHELREQRTQQQLSADEEHRRLTVVEMELDQCWDLLRQREARRDAGQDPASATVRPAGEVENYLG
jgi:hypothetical protein